MKTGIFIGRFQPFHDGHKACIARILECCQTCLVLVRDTEQNERNPYTVAERTAMIRSVFPDESRVQILPVPDSGCDLTVYRGRDVGWNVEDIHLPPEIEAISATSLRKRE